jgi:hypothetical protein
MVNRESMTDFNSEYTRLDKYYKKISDNVIYSRDYEKIYKIGNFYFKNKEYDKMTKYYRYIIDAYNHYDRLEDEPLFISPEDLETLYNLVQQDISCSMKALDKQKTCADLDSCLDTNLFLYR